MVLDFLTGRKNSFFHYRIGRKGKDCLFYSGGQLKAKPKRFTYFQKHMPTPEMEGNNQGGEELSLDNLEELTVDELLDFAKSKALKEKELERQFAEYRSNSEKWVQKLLEKSKKENVIDEEKISSIVNQKVQEKYVTSTLNTVKNQLWADERALFEEEFADITEWKVLTEETVDKYIEKTLKIIWKQKTDVMWMHAWVWWKRPSVTPAQNAEASKTIAKSFVEEYWL